MVYSSFPGGKQLGLAGLGWTLLHGAYSAVLTWELRCCCFQFCSAGMAYKGTRAGAGEAGREERRHRRPAAPATRPGESPHPIGTACPVPTRSTTRSSPLWLPCSTAGCCVWELRAGAGTREPAAGLCPSPRWRCCRSRSFLGSAGFLVACISSSSCVPI